MNVFRVLFAMALSVAAIAAQVVPRPRQLDVRDGEARAGGVVACVEPAFRPQVAVLRRALERLGAADARVVGDAPEEVAVVVRRGDVDGDEAYRIETSDRDALVVTAGSTVGVARAMATLAQLVRVEDGAARWPRVSIVDAPDLPFRCFMVDMGRNPHPPAVLRQVLDAAWFYKVRYVQLHLSDDQLFSWPSRVFPKLGDARAGWRWDDFVALEADARARGIAIIPEIDVPGHSTLLRKRSPDVFGANPTELASRASAQRGVEQLIEELLTVFASTPYVHLGGDEAYGVPGDTQRDFINRLNEFVRAQGRRSIVWEGPRLGEGDHKVATDVLHMNWRTVDFPAQDMLDAGYEVVNAAWDPLYIVDHYPRTMFTAVDVRRCYEWDLQRFAHVNHGMPTFARPHRTTTADGIVGFCMPWWEGRAENVLPLCVPRLAAVAAAAWNRAGEADFDDFASRQRRLLSRFEVVAEVSLGRLPFAQPEAVGDNLAYRAPVRVSTGASQPVYGPARLTNGIATRFDHFLGYPTKPEPLVITVDLGRAVDVARVVVHETSVGTSHEVYELCVSVDGEDYETVGRSGEGTRGERTFVDHRFEARPVRYVQVRTEGCHGLTFPSFSRLTEIEAFAR